MSDIIIYYDAEDDWAADDDDIIEFAKITTTLPLLDSTMSVFTEPATLVNRRDEILKLMAATFKINHFLPN